jgi:branched-chain amino acid transport system substrate-binding protein
MAEAGYGRQSSKWTIRGFALAASLLLSACATIVPKGPPPAAPVAPATKPPLIAVPGSLPEDQARHRIALLVPLTGPNAAVGQSIANAAALALADTGGKDLRITNYDTAPGAAAAATKALADGNRLLLGPLLAEDVRAVAAPAAAARVPVIGFSNDATITNDNVWLLGFSPAQSIDRVVRYAKSRGLTRFAGLIPQGVYGRNAAGLLIRSAEAAGGTVVVMQNYDRTPASLQAAITKLAKVKYDALLIADSGRIAVAPHL